jgi:hypothetical protein
MKFNAQTDFRIFWIFPEIAISKDGIGFVWLFWGIALNWSEK